MFSSCVYLLYSNSSSTPYFSGVFRDQKSANECIMKQTEEYVTDCMDDGSIETYEELEKEYLQFQNFTIKIVSGINPDKPV